MVPSKNKNMFQNVKQKTARKIPNLQKSSNYSNKLKHYSKKPQYPKIASNYTQKLKIFQFYFEKFQKAPNIGSHSKIQKISKCSKKF